MPASSVAVRSRGKARRLSRDANLLWPVNEVWSADGEIDYDEEDVIATSAGAFFHNLGATSGSDQEAESDKIDDTQWHVIGLEWLAGKSLKWFVDG